MNYSRPGTASLLYFISMLGFLASAAFLYFVIKNSPAEPDRAGMLFVLTVKEESGALGFSLLALVGAVVIDLLAKINHNVALLVHDSDARTRREHPSGVHQRMVIPGLND